MKQKCSALQASRVAALLAVTVLCVAPAQAGDWRWAFKYNSRGTTAAASYGHPATPPRATPSNPPVANHQPAPVQSRTGTSLFGGTTFSILKVGSSVSWGLAFGW